MSTSQPIRNKNELQELKNYYYETEQNLRNYALICLGINSALRISDLLDLRWRDVYSFERSSFLTHISIQEQKTGKETRVALNKNATQGLCCYMNSLGQVTANSYIFPGRSSDQHLSRTQAFRIIRHASEQLHFENKLSCHSMRKTFGYHAWKCGTPPAVLMDINNHSSYAITKRYLGIEQDDKDDVFLHLNL